MTIAAKRHCHDNDNRTINVSYYLWPASHKLQAVTPADPLYPDFLPRSSASLTALFLNSFSFDVPFSLRALQACNSLSHYVARCSRRVLC